jgi:hypothetical protein
MQAPTGHPPNGDTDRDRNADRDPGRVAADKPGVGPVSTSS